MNKHLKLFSILFLLLLATPVWSALEITQSNSPHSHVPKGASNVVMMSFRLDSTGADINVSQVIIENISDTVRFNLGISQIQLFLDDNANGVLDLTGVDSDSLLSSETLSAGSGASQELLFSTPVLISSTNITDTSFLIVYDFSATQATLTATANVTITEINSTDGDNDLDVSLHTNTGVPTSNTIIVTGIRDITVQDISPEVVLPGQTQVPMLYVSIGLSGESVTDPSLMAFSILNEENNYVTDNSKTNGIIEANMYLAVNEPPFRSELESESSIKTILPDNFGSKSTLDFDFPHYPSEFGGIIKYPAVTKNFYILYDVGENISVTSETKISAQLSSFSGFGDTSQLEMLWPLSGEVLFDPAESLVAGLSLEEIKTIVPDGDIFGAETTAPMLAFRIRSNHTDITVNSFTIYNEVSAGGTVPFITNTNSSDGITKVDIYVDSDGNEEFDPSNDTRLGFVDLGSVNSITGINNQSDTVVVPLQSGAPSVDGYLISAYDEESFGYPSNNDAVFFVQYTFGKSISGGVDPSGNITFKSVARLGRVRATADITVEGIVSSTSLGLSGVSDDDIAFASPEAIINLSVVNAAIQHVHDISPENVYLGQLKVPMLGFKISADLRFVSTSVTIVNDGKSFLNDNTGVSKVLIYKDREPFEEFDESIDEFINSVSVFTDRKTLEIPGIDINATNANYYLLLYDIGQNDNEVVGDTISTKFIKAQLDDIETDSSADTTLILGGQMPLPIEPASVTVSRGFIDTVDVEVFNSSAAANTTLNVTLGFTNTSGSAIDVESVNPRIYLSSLAGRDISYEFNIVSDDDIDFPLAIPNSQTVSFDFKIRHFTQESEGAALLDTTIQYTVPGQMTPVTGSILLSRYQDIEGYSSGVTDPPVLSLFTSFDDYFWVFPSHIFAVEFERSTAKATFSQGMALKLGDKLHVTFQDNGDFIDEASLKVSLNGTYLSRVSLADNSEGTYTYDSSSGLLTVSQLGSSGGRIEIDADDGVNELTQAVLTFEINTSVQLSNVLFYPNPYRMGTDSLILGYFTTQPCDVTLYLFDHNGVQVLTETQTSTTIGYDEFIINANTNALAPGIYLCRVVAEDSSGDKTFKIAKLSIF
jgi:hypothetical protein